jgi:hypothetical protein
MAVINDPTTSTNVTRVGEVATGATGAVHVVLKPLPTSIGHYRTNHRCVLAATQAANSRIFESRNTHATNLIIPTRLIVKAVQDAAGTAQGGSLDVFKVTAFSAVDTTNTVTPTTSLKRTSGMSATTAALRGVTVAGAAAGMTGGTLTKDGNSAGQLPFVVIAAANGNVIWREDILDDVNGTYPFVLVQNEGLIVENRVLNVTSFGFSAYIDHSFAEVVAY